MPQIRPFRALRFDPAVVGDLGLVVAPPYDVIDTERQGELLARHPANVVRLDLPAAEAGDEPDDRYRRAARTLAAWRSDGTLHKDPHPSIYVYEQTYCVPGTSTERVQRGFFGRLRLEAFEPGAGVLPHERTLSGPKEDRYKLLRATGVNTSPVVALYRDPAGRASELLDALTARAPDVDVTDDEGTRHRLWATSADGEEPDVAVAALMAAAGRGPVFIADGHHRYETALRYRDERRMTRSCEEDPAFDYILTLLLEVNEPLTVLPTHRLVRAGAGIPDRAAIPERARELFDVEEGVAADRLREEFEAPAQGGRGRFGIWLRDSGGSSAGAILTARRHLFRPWLPQGGEAVNRLDVTLLEVALERIVGVDAGAVTAGAIGYTKSVRDALAAVGSGTEFNLAFLLEPTPVAEVLAVAADGDVMPQKSTYFHPKALTGLVINPHEW